MKYTYSIIPAFKYISCFTENEILQDGSSFRSAAGFIFHQITNFIYNPLCSSAALLKHMLSVSLKTSTYGIKRPQQRISLKVNVMLVEFPHMATNPFSEH